MGISSRVGDLVGQIYEKALMNEISQNKVPNHIGIITDGNRRYAMALGISTDEGHVAGKNKLEDVLDWCREIGIKVVTVYAFSTENFRRDKKEINFLFKLINQSLIDLMNDERVKKFHIGVKVIGEKINLPDFLVDTIREVEEATSANRDFRLNLAVGYGGREEIINAVRKILKDGMEGKITPADISEAKFREYLYDGNIPDPDLILRTSGEERVSNFLIWQSAYSELYFTDVYWPEFRKVDFLRAIKSYQMRKRRFGE
ncbi:MAG: polyprenyl diphosphate synthase [Candidatus Thermoplasmatota archaeon]|nr:polyprenyl diphosphate synthase [Candidatus Thermoplasmatota archaeon]